MFDITYKGANCVVFNTKKSTLVADPKVSVAGGKDASVKGSIELLTEERFGVTSPDMKLLIDGPGEYEVGDFSIVAIAAKRHLDAGSDETLATIYRIEIGDVRCALLGNIDSKLSDEQLESLGIVDVLLLPVGGNGYTLDATSAVLLTRQIEPKAVIPLHYADSGLQYEVPQDDVKTFITELGAPSEQVDKYKLKSSVALPAVMTVIEVTRS